jgi:hypothetical protein
VREISTCGFWPSVAQRPSAGMPAPGCCVWNVDEGVVRSHRATFQRQRGAGFPGTATVRPLRGCLLQDHPQTQGGKVLQTGRRGDFSTIVHSHRATRTRT